ncbi:hypothetical protein HY546_03025 [archaeon]|nr:hypothetical protein [archaeon]
MENDAFGSNLEFSDEGGMNSDKFSRAEETPLLVRWAMKIKFIKTKEQANYLLLGVAVAAALLSIYFFTAGGSSPRVTIPQGPNGLPGGDVIPGGAVIRTQGT